MARSRRIGSGCGNVRLEPCARPSPSQCLLRCSSRVSSLRGSLALISGGDPRRVSRPHCTAPNANSLHRARVSNNFSESGACSEGAIFLFPAADQDARPPRPPVEASQRASSLGCNCRLLQPLVLSPPPVCACTSTSSSTGARIHLVHTDQPLQLPRALHCTWSSCAPRPRRPPARAFAGLSHTCAGSPGAASDKPPLLLHASGGAQWV